MVTKITMDIEKNKSLQNIALLDDGDFMDNDIDPHDATLRYKTLTWPKATVLLLSVYICLPLMSFPWAFSILGLVPGIIITAFITFITWYTGLTITEYSIANPGVTDVCDIEILMGLYFFGPGVYSTVQSIVWNYQSGEYGSPFSCASTAFIP